MKRPEYMRIYSKYFSQDMKSKYSISSLVVEDGYVYCKIKRGMYGLKQTARLAYDNLVTNLKKDGYFPDKHCPNIWSHESRPTKFCLCVDHFGVKYFTEDDAQHLITSLKQSYAISIDWSGQHFCGLDIEWNYDKEYADISVKHFVIKTLQRLQHIFPSKAQYAPHSWTVLNYGIIACRPAKTSKSLSYPPPITPATGIFRLTHSSKT